MKMSVLLPIVCTEQNSSVLMDKRLNPRSAGPVRGLFISQTNKWKCSYPTCGICEVVMWVIVMWNCFEIGLMVCVWLQ